MLPHRLLLACIALVASHAAMAVDEPQYKILRTGEDFEVRQYAPYLVAETVVDTTAENAGSQGFRILAGYIFGANKGARKIAMTAPVAQTPVKIAMTAPVAQAVAPGGYRVQFAMPAEWTLETLPEPDDARVQLAVIPARTLAVLKYSGTWMQANYDENLQKLKSALAQNGLRWHGEPISAKYDPPWIPWFMRRNEIWLELD